MSRRVAVVTFLVLGDLAVVSAAFAREAIPKEVTAERALAEPRAATPRGWAFKLMVGATGSYGHSKNVVGSVAGSTIQLGLVVTGSADLATGQSTWENVLKINGTQTRTPQLDSFVKSADELSLQSTYLYHLPSVDWFGPFARAAMSTQVFASYDVRTTDVTVSRTFRDGTTVTEPVAATDHIELTESFEPILLKEGAGAFANPYTTKPLTVRAKAGVGLQHVSVRDGLTLVDDKSTPEIELKQLENSTQGGGEIEVDLGGQLSENVFWSAKGNVFYPFYTSVKTELTGLHLASTDLSAKVSVRLAKWASLDYVLSVKRIPLVLDEWQVQNNVLLIAGFDVI